jgi:hypothetical protein
MRRKWLIAATLALALAGALATAGPAQATDDGIRNSLCAGTGELNTDPSVTPVLWTIRGQGACPGAQVVFSGSGTSDNLGLCSRNLVVTNLQLEVDVTLNRADGEVINETETWFSPITLFPLATTFFVDGDENGAGVGFHRIGLRCPPGGNPAATFSWTRL